MKKLLLMLVAVILTASANAQSPEKMSYQAVIRNSSNSLVTNQAVGMRIRIIQGNVFGASVYVETHTPTTNANGLVTLEIGNGTVVSGSMSTIDWSAGPYFIQTETDPTGGTTYSITGTSQFMSVPYALHSKTATTVINPCGLSIGQTYQGGIIFYLDPSGCHGLIAAPSDQHTGAGATWSNGSPIDTRAYGSGLFEGKYNTDMIWIAQGFGTTSAADICYHLMEGGYDDWYLPSIEELNKMYQNIGQGNVLGLGNLGGFTNGWYWSSTEYYDSNYVWGQYFLSGDQGSDDKNLANYVRAVRAF